MRLFDRRVHLQVDTLVVEHLRVVFKVERSVSKEPNKAEIQIYNLSEEGRARVQKKDAAIVLQAGYPETMAQIFSGEAARVSHVRSGADWVTKIQSGDGEKQFRTARISAAFKGGATPDQIVKALISAMGVKAGNAISELGNGNFAKGITEFTHGLTLNGLAQKEMDLFLRSLGLTFSIQDGALQVLRFGQALNAPAVVLNPSSGLIGSPEFAETAKDKRTILKIKSLLQPELVPGRKVKLESETKDCVARVDKVTHTGDSWGGSTSPWYSDVECMVLST
jgi:hypothetical protein